MKVDEVAAVWVLVSASTAACEALKANSCDALISTALTQSKAPLMTIWAEDRNVKLALGPLIHIAEQRRSGLNGNPRRSLTGRVARISVEAKDHGSALTQFASSATPSPVVT
jgi:hypothetical protein